MLNSLLSFSYGGGFQGGASSIFNGSAIVAQSTARVRNIAGQLYRLVQLPSRAHLSYMSISTTDLDRWDFPRDRKVNNYRLVVGGNEPLSSHCS
jgi:hypothetical protein